METENHVGHERTLEGIETLRDELRPFREIILGDLVMLGEIAAPSCGEGERVAALLERFVEIGLDRVSADEAGNGVGVLRGASGGRSILVAAHADTVFDDSVDHSLFVSAERVTGPGVADNSLGLAVLVALPTLLERLGIVLQSDLVLLGAARGLGRGNLGGMRFFLENHREAIVAGVCLEGVQLGRLSYSSVGMLRGLVQCRVPEEYDWMRPGQASAIAALNEVLTRMLMIPLPRLPRTSITLGTIGGGSAFDTVAAEAHVGFEVRSEQVGMVSGIQERIDEIVAEVAAASRMEVGLEVIARCKPGGIPFGHPLPRYARAAMGRLGVGTHVYPSVGELSVLIDGGIPGITLGVSTGEHLHQVSESVSIEPIASGVAQVISVLLAIDGGLCDGG